MFGTILTSIYTLMLLYVFWRIIAIPIMARSISKKIVVCIGVMLWLIFFAGRFIEHNAANSFSTVIELFGMNALGTVLLFFIPIFIVDIVTGFGNIMPKLSQYFRLSALIVGCLLSIIALVQGMRPPVIQNYDVVLAGLPANLDGTTLVAISDTHLGSLLNKKWFEARVAQLKSLKPDIVVLLGDIDEGHGSSQDEFVPVLRTLSAPLGVWAVLGNHETHRRSNSSIALVENLGLKVLRNTWNEISPGLILSGVDDLTANQHLGQKKDLISMALLGKPKSTTILLSHSPLDAERAAEQGVQLMLSGHTHAGQIWPFNYLVAQRYPLIGGRYEVKGMTVIVCRGTGTWGPRMRLWHPNEIVRVTMHSKK